MYSNEYEYLSGGRAGLAVPLVRLAVRVLVNTELVCRRVESPHNAVHTLGRRRARASVLCIRRRRRLQQLLPDAGARSCCRGRTSVCARGALGLYAFRAERRHPLRGPFGQHEVLAQLRYVVSFRCTRIEHDSYENTSTNTCTYEYFLAIALLACAPLEQTRERVE